MKQIAIETDNIQLDQFLKWSGIIDSGGQAGYMVAAGKITLNGKKETAKRRKLYPGDILFIEDQGSFEIIRQGN